MNDCPGLYTKIVVAPGGEIDEEQCPRCDRPPLSGPSARTARSQQHLWRAYLLLILAAYLGLVFGPPALADYLNTASAEAWLRATEGLSANVNLDPDRYVLRHVRESATPWETYVLAHERLDRDISALALAALTALLGFGALVREIWRSIGEQRSTAVTVGWGLFEGVGLPIVYLLLIGFGCVVGTALIRGERPTGALVDSAVSRILDLLPVLVRSVQ